LRSTHLEVCQKSLQSSIVANKESTWPITSSPDFVQLVILSEAKNLGFSLSMQSEMFRVAQHDKRRQLFLFLKLDLLAEKLGIAGVFCQERNYGR
jgi:hypothetical protein